MTKKDNIQVFWWSSVRFENKLKENFGDILSKYLVEKISGKNVVWRHPIKMKWNPFIKTIYFTTGSILAHVTNKCVVWGSGIISKEDNVSNATFLAVRGPETYECLINKGYKVDKVFGDPAIVLPIYYNPKLEMQFKLGIIPHYVDYQKISEWYKNDESVKVIDLLNDDVEAVVDQILSCKQILSSSLHGIIVSHAYNIPAVWVEFSNKLSGDGVKFVDYFKSVSLQPYKPNFIEVKPSTEQIKGVFNIFVSLPKPNVINNLSINLLKACPFKA